MAPGELITLLGSDIGPVSALQSSGCATSTVLGGISVLFDGTAAPLLYAVPNKINIIAPFEVLETRLPQLTITSQGQPVAGVALTAAAPGLVSGVLQVNARIAADAPSGSAIQWCPPSDRRPVRPVSRRDPLTK